MAQAAPARPEPHTLPCRGRALSATSTGFARASAPALAPGAGLGVGATIPGMGASQVQVRSPVRLQGRYKRQLQGALAGAALSEPLQYPLPASA